MRDLVYVVHVAHDDNGVQAATLAVMAEGTVAVYDVHDDDRFTGLMSIVDDITTIDPKIVHLGGVAAVTEQEAVTVTAPTVEG